MSPAGRRRGFPAFAWSHATSGVALLTGAMMLSVLPACRTEGLAFREDRRVEIVHPKHRATVQLPVTIRWTVRDFVVAAPDGSAHPGRGHFGVFVDGPPVAPGKSLDSLARGDEVCEVTPGCPDAEWFAARGIYETTDTRFRIEFLPDNRDDSAEPSRQRDSHEVTIAFLNGRRERVGEAGFSVQFFVERPG